MQICKLITLLKFQEMNGIYNSSQNPQPWCKENYDVHFLSFFLSIHNLFFFFLFLASKRFMELPCNVYIKPHWNPPTTDLTKALLSNLFSQPTKKKKKNLQKIQKREGAPLPSCQQRTMVAEMKEAINRVCEAGLSRALAGLFNWRRGCLESVGSRCHSSLPESEKTFAERWFRHFTWHHLLDFIKNLAWSFHT